MDEIALSIKQLSHNSSNRPSSLISPCGHNADMSGPEDNDSSSVASTDSKPSKSKSKKFGALKSLGKSNPLRKALSSHTDRHNDGSNRRATYESPSFSGSGLVSNSASMPSLATVTSIADESANKSGVEGEDSKALSGKEKQQKYQQSRALSTPLSRISEPKRCNSLESFATSMVVNCCISGNVDTNGDFDNGDFDNVTNCLPLSSDIDMDVKVLGSSVEDGSEKQQGLLVSDEEGMGSVKGHLEFLADPLDEITTDEDTVKTDDIQFNLVDKTGPLSSAGENGEGENGEREIMSHGEGETSTEIILQQGLPPDAMNGLPDLHDIQVTINEHKLRLHMERNRRDSNPEAGDVDERDGEEEEQVEHCAINETVQPHCQVLCQAPFDRTLSPRNDVFEPRPLPNSSSGGSGGGGSNGKVCEECKSAQSVPSSSCMGCFSFIHSKSGNTGNQAEPCIVRPAQAANTSMSNAMATGECTMPVRLAGDNQWEAPDQR